MRLAFFIHSFVSDWNHGNAHFLRGLLDSLARQGHQVASWEPRRAWSLQNLLADHGIGPVADVVRAFPSVEIHTYEPASPDLAAALDEAVRGADVVVVHEWSEPHVAAAIRKAAARAGALALFHDTHHRPVSQPGAIAALRPAEFDGVLAFGDVLRQVYVDRFGVENAWTFHEAADHLRFRPLDRPREQDVVWIGNWGDEERTQELRAFWLDGARAMPELRWVAHGVRYPAYARAELADAGVELRGWVPSLEVPEVFARSRATLHVPRRAYVDTLAGIPTIRVFEALACGIPLVCAPWKDAEGLFRPGDYATAATPAEMHAAISRLCADDDARAGQAARGRETILARHTCDHRAAELLAIVAELGRAGAAGTPTAAETACA
jgi:spore maturation protein CgeB